MGARSTISSKWWQQPRAPHYDCDRKTFCYRKVTHETVRPDLRASVESVATFALKDLGLDITALHISLVWVESVPWTKYPQSIQPMSHEAAERSTEYFDRPVDLLAYTPGGQSNELWFRSDVEASLEFETTVAHEVRHLFQKINCRDVFDDKPNAEADANDYAFDAISRHLNQVGKLTAEIRERLRQGREQAIRLAEAQALWGLFRAALHAAPD